MTKTGAEQVMELATKSAAIIEHLTNVGISVSITKPQYPKNFWTDDALCLRIDGFYKWGHVDLRCLTIGPTIGMHDPEDNVYGLYAFGRYDEKYGDGRLIKEPYDLIKLNYDLWVAFRDRFEGWKSPEKGWDILMEQTGMVEKTTSFSPRV